MSTDGAERQRRYRERHKEKINERNRLALQEQRRADPERFRAYNRKSYRKHPERAQARNAVIEELRRGRMARQPCEVCGEVKGEAHHDDYGKPLEVRWLCRPHHALADKARERQENEQR